MFAAIGAGVPGLSQIGFTQAVRHAGAARTAVLIGVAPLLSFALAAIFLGEGLNAGLVAGAALIVVAGASLSFERRWRPEGYRTLGAVLAVLCAGLFGVATRSCAGPRATPRSIPCCARWSRSPPRRSCSLPGAR